MNRIVKTEEGSGHHARRRAGRCFRCIPKFLSACLSIIGCEETPKRFQRGSKEPPKRFQLGSKEVLKELLKGPYKVLELILEFILEVLEVVVEVLAVLEVSTRSISTTQGSPQVRPAEELLGPPEPPISTRSIHAATRTISSRAREVP